MITEEQYAEWFRENEGMCVDKYSSDEYWEANGFIIRTEQVSQTRRSIGRVVITDVIEYVIYGTKVTPATQWEPEDADEVELARERNFGQALIRVLLIEKEDDLNNGLGSWEEAETTKDYVTEMTAPLNKGLWCPRGNGS
jgi:hypothetical protein